MTASRSGSASPSATRVTYRGRWVALSPLEHALLQALVGGYGDVVPYDTIVRAVWPDGRLAASNALRVHTTRLRRRIRSLGLEIRSVPSRGYVLEAAPS